MTTQQLLKTAKSTCGEFLKLTQEQKNNALNTMADCLVNDTESILKSNNIDIEAAKGTITDVMLDRLTLTAERIKGMAEGMRAVAKLQDPIGEIISNHKTPNGLSINKVRVPMGVVAIIYESRPNVTSDAAALCFKSSNVCVLRGGKESINANKAIVSSLHNGLKKCNLPTSLINLVEDTTRASSNELMTAVGKVDLLVPRGGAGLINAITQNAKVPCIQTGTGICHIYVEKTADFDKALNIIENAKTSRPSVCNAAEVCVVDKDIAKEYVPLLYDRLVNKRKEKGEIPVELRLDEQAFEFAPSGVKAGENDFNTEFLNYIMAVKIVDGVSNAIEHINSHSTGHSEAIVTNDKQSANMFTNLIDSAAVYVNASTRFTDGGEFGLGCEMGISTQKLHARGPMGLCELTSYKYVINGDGQIR